MSALDEIASINARLAEVKVEIETFAREKGRSVVSELTQPLFDLGVTDVVWTQYTPYFNDGDACVFRVHEPSLGAEPYGYEASSVRNAYEGNSWRAADDPYYVEQREDLLSLGVTEENWEAVTEALNNLTGVVTGNQEIMNYAFGDHVIIHVTPGNIEVEEYQHD